MMLDMCPLLNGIKLDMCPLLNGIKLDMCPLLNGMMFDKFLLSGRLTSAVSTF